MAFDKVQHEYQFVNLSGYARPVARVLTRLLIPTPITPIHLTLIYSAIGFFAAALYTTGDATHAVIAGVLLIVKNMIDAVDGSLARARNRPSRVGRFLDSIFDYLVNAAIMLAIGSRRATQIGSLAPIVVAVLALECMTWQGTAFNHYYVMYRHLTGGDKTSKIDESGDERYPWDNPIALKVLLALYRVIYGWQDRLIVYIDQRFISRSLDNPAYRDKRLMTLTTGMGLGQQLLWMAVLSWLNQTEWIPLLFLGPYNLYWLVLMLYRRRKSVTS